jgi:hypothetical protein
MKTIERMRVDEEVFLDFFREYINWKSILAAMAKMMSRKNCFSQLNMTGHALLWCEAYCLLQKGKEPQITEWEWFKQLLKKQLYPLRYKQE